MSTERETEQPKAITRAEMRADLDAMVSKANARQPAPAPSLPLAIKSRPMGEVAIASDGERSAIGATEADAIQAVRNMQPAPSAGDTHSKSTHEAITRLATMLGESLEAGWHIDDLRVIEIIDKAREQVPMKHAALRDLADARAELGSNTDLPSPTGSVYALKNWWKQQHEVAAEQAAALRGALGDIIERAKQDARDHFNDEAVAFTWTYVKIATKALTVSAGAGWLEVAEQAPILHDGEDMPVYAWDGKNVTEDAWAEEYDQPAGPAIGGWVKVGEWFVSGNPDITHWKPRVLPLPPPPAEPAAEGGGL